MLRFLSQGEKTPSQVFHVPSSSVTREISPRQDGNAHDLVGDESPDPHHLHPSFVLLDAAFVHFGGGAELVPSVGRCRRGCSRPCRLCRQCPALTAAIAAAAALASSVATATALTNILAQCHCPHRSHRRTPSQSPQPLQSLSAIALAATAAATVTAITIKVNAPLSFSGGRRHTFPVLFATICLLFGS